MVDNCTTKFKVLASNLSDEIVNNCINVKYFAFKLEHEHKKLQNSRVSDEFNVSR